ncbi:methyltransferase [Defluviimonas sp. 20V17]|uniref:Methyltransferase n=1 Tax=Allgaiera indica TaxID=765699 RepID=A0AAN4USC3_9RHOB|nr:DUF938 domain-containing protein [Allgaiera indica]KDB02269.1 methyltransferase [Defluviimonas sp. 20V17]GHE02858.1 methyltransferase [Allgaiera indica]SDX16732.1 Protein of unknown function [Allgaiera indica]
MTGLQLPDSAALRAQAEGGCRISPSALRNVEPILAQMELHAPQTGRALEIASGTGQHMVRYAARRPNLTWQPSDLNPANMASIAAWRQASGAANIRAPITLDAGTPGWAAKLGPLNLVVMVNVLHLVTEAAACTILAETAAALAPAGVALIYGPFLRDGVPTSEGDRRFDESLRAQNAGLGYKDAAWVAARLAAAGLTPAPPAEMPANNLMFVARAAR